VFRIADDGTGLGTQIVRAISALANFAPLDIGAVAANDAQNRDAQGNAVDAVAAFIQVLRADANAPAPCASGLTVDDRAPIDGVPDTVVGVTPGTRVCFDVVPKRNLVVRAAPRPQLFRATITVVGGGVTTLSTREVYFLVPPAIPQPPVQ
jgi:hypothetical protein